MWWECGECGFQVEGLTRPIRCNECGTAGPVYAAVEADEVAPRTADERRRAWFEMGTMWRTDVDQLAA